MTQSDLPLFGVLKRERFTEAVRQAEEMERLVRSHPCNVINSYINEPFPNANNKPHRHLERPELQDFFKSADIIVKMNNPDRVIKHVDGDYDPPSETLPDNHCYTFWYNGHGIEAGRLLKGEWMPVRKNWNYGCGEFGVEGLESSEIMREYYPSEWLLRNADEEKDWSPRKIVGSQTGNFHYLFFPTPRNLEGWIEASQDWQAEGVKRMTEAFRRDSRMVTFALHLFIDAFPSGWMKTIMDFKRNPKPAYFAYRNALEPIMLCFRSDRLRYFSGERIRTELWLCNDLEELSNDVRISYRVEMGDKVIVSGSVKAEVPSCSSRFQGFLDFKAPAVSRSEQLVFRAALIDENNRVLNDASEACKVFPVSGFESSLKIWTPDKSKDYEIISYLRMSRSGNLSEADLIISEDIEECLEKEDEILEAVESGTTLLLMNLPAGTFNFAGNRIEVKECGMMPVHFTAPSPEDVDDKDFRFWYDPAVDRISPILYSTFMAEGFSPILTSGNTNDAGEWGMALAVGEKSFGKGKIAICQVVLEGRLAFNPPATILLRRLIGRDS